MSQWKSLHSTSTFAVKRNKENKKCTRVGCGTNKHVDTLLSVFSSTSRNYALTWCWLIWASGTFLHISCYVGELTNKKGLNKAQGINWLFLIMCLAHSLLPTYIRFLNQRQSGTSCLPMCCTWIWKRQMCSSVVTPTHFQPAPSGSGEPGALN